MKIILYVGNHTNANNIRENLDREVYKVHHLQGDTALMSELGAPYTEDPNMVLCEIDSLGAAFKNAVELISFIRQGDKGLPIALLGDKWPDERLCSLGANIKIFLSGDKDLLIKYIQNTLHTKH